MKDTTSSQTNQETVNEDSGDLFTSSSNHQDDDSNAVVNSTDTPSIPNPSSTTSSASIIARLNSLNLHNVLGAVEANPLQKVLIDVGGDDTPQYLSSQSASQGKLNAGDVMQTFKHANNEIHCLVALPASIKNMRDKFVVSGVVKSIEDSIKGNGTDINFLVNNFNKAEKEINNHGQYYLTNHPYYGLYDKNFKGFVFALFPHPKQSQTPEKFSKKLEQAYSQLFSGVNEFKAQLLANSDKIVLRLPLPWCGKANKNPDGTNIFSADQVADMHKEALLTVLQNPENKKLFDETISSLEYVVYTSDRDEYAAAFTTRFGREKDRIQQPIQYNPSTESSLVSQSSNNPGSTFVGSLFASQFRSTGSGTNLPRN